MGDVRYEAHYRRLIESADRAAALGEMADDEVIQALAAASRDHDALLANVLATEAMNRMRRSRVITENLAEGTFAVDVKRRVTFVNPALARRLGTRWDEAIGRPFHETIRLLEGSELVGDTERCPVFQAIDRGEVVDWQGMVDGPRGETFAALLTVSPVEVEGTIEGAVATVRDISEMRHLLARYESLFAHLGPTFFLDPDGILLDVNAAAASALHARPEDVRGKHFSSYVVHEDLPQAGERLARVLAGERRTDEYRVVRADGSRALLRLTGVAMFDGDRLVGVHGFGEVVRELEPPSGR